MRNGQQIATVTGPTKDDVVRSWGGNISVTDAGAALRGAAPAFSSLVRAAPARAQRQSQRERNECECHRLGHKDDLAADFAAGVIGRVNIEIQPIGKQVRELRG